MYDYLPEKDFPHFSGAVRSARGPPCVGDGHGRPDLFQKAKGENQMNVSLLIHAALFAAVGGLMLMGRIVFVSLIYRKSLADRSSDRLQ